MTPTKKRGPRPKDPSEKMESDTVSLTQLQWAELRKMTNKSLFLRQLLTANGVGVKKTQSKISIQ